MHNLRMYDDKENTFIQHFQKEFDGGGDDSKKVVITFENQPFYNQTGPYVQTLYLTGSDKHVEKCRKAM